MKTNKKTKRDFAKFLTNHDLTINYDNKYFYKKYNEEFVDIYVLDEHIYRIDRVNKVLLVLNASYCCLNDEKYFNLDKISKLKEYIFDEKTLIRVSNLIKSF